MKKIFACLMILFCISLCGCNNYDRNKNFSDELLKSAFLTNMPLPKSEIYGLKNNVEGQETMAFETSLEEYKSYVKTFVQYMLDRNDVYHFGYQKNDGLIAEMLPHIVVYKIDESFDYSKQSCKFSYSLSNKTINLSSCSHKHYYENMHTVSLSYGTFKENSKYDMTIKIEINDRELCIDKSLIRDDEIERYYLHEFEDWLWMFYAEDVKEIAIEEGKIGVEPGSVTKIKTTTDEEEIKRLVKETQEITIELIEDDSWEVDGGSFTTIVFTLKNGMTHTIYSSNGYYSKYDKHYKLSFIPSIKEDKVTSTYERIRK